MAADTRGLTQTGVDVAGCAGEGLKTFWTRINADYTVGGGGAETGKVSKDNGQ